MSDLNSVTSVEQDGRVLSGLGADAGQLEAVMERHAPESAESASAGTVVAPTAEGDAATATPAPDAPPPTRGRQRFADLTKARDEANARAEAAERKAAELEARHAAPVAREPEPVKAEPAKPAEKFTFPEYADYAAEHPDVSYSAWELERLHAFSAWDKQQQQTDIDSRIRQSIEADRASRSLMDTREKTWAKGRDSYKDFDAILTSGPGSRVNLGPTEDSAKARVKFIYAHPQSEHLQYAIMKDGELAKRLSSLDDIGFGLEISKIAPSGSGASPASPARAGSVTPPAPYQPVGSGSITTVSPSAELAKKGFDFDKSGYREKRAAELGRNRRR